MTSRERFQSWATAQEMQLPLDTSVEMTRNGPRSYYVSLRTEAAWLGWVARARSDAIVRRVTARKRARK